MAVRVWYRNVISRGSYNTREYYLKLKTFENPNKMVKVTNISDESIIVISKLKCR